MKLDPHSEVLLFGLAEVVTYSSRQPRLLLYRASGTVHRLTGRDIRLREAAAVELPERASGVAARQPSDEFPHELKPSFIELRVAWVQHKLEVLAGHYFVDSVSSEFRSARILTDEDHRLVSANVSGPHEHETIHVSIHEDLHLPVIAPAGPVAVVGG